MSVAMILHPIIAFMSGTETLVPFVYLNYDTTYILQVPVSNLGQDIIYYRDLKHEGYRPYEASSLVFYDPFPALVSIIEPARKNFFLI
jgi:hypothetical protein